MSEGLELGREPEDVRRLFAARAQATGGDATDEQLRRLAGRLWGCVDPMPAPLCACLQLPTGATYAMAARALRVRSGSPLPPYGSAS